MTTVDVIKAAYRQTKDGFAITFILHPQDDHDELARAAIGSQWQIRAVPLDEDGNASSDAGNKPLASDKEAGPCEEKPGPASHLASLNAGTRTPATQQRDGADAGKEGPSRLTRQAGIACNDPMFWSFLRSHYMLSATVGIARHAATAVRMICHVQSRREFIPGTPAGDRWEELYGKFIAWRDMPDAA